MAKMPLQETPKFELADIRNMVCSDCAMKGAGKAGICDAYEDGKPLEVIDGGSCPKYIHEVEE